MDPTQHELDESAADEFDPDIPDESTSSLSSSLEHYTQDGAPIRHIDRFEQQNSTPCEDQLAPFSCAPGYKLVSWFILSKVSKSRNNE